MIDAHELSAAPADNPGILRAYVNYCSSSTSILFRSAWDADSVSLVLKPTELYSIRSEVRFRLEL